jgi:transcriptional regulator with XRE-family HTH domain
MKIGQKIKQRRTELKWSQRDLAAKMDYDHSTIGRIERGTIDIPQSRILQFSEVLGVPISYLMGWEEEMQVQPTKLAERHFEMIMDEDINEIFEEFRSLDDRKKKAVKDLIHSLAEMDV